jgi:hypothetical protein
VVEVGVLELENEDLGGVGGVLGAYLMCWSIGLRSLVYVGVDLYSEL